MRPLKMALKLCWLPLFCVAALVVWMLLRPESDPNMAYIVVLSALGGLPGVLFIAIKRAKADWGDDPRDWPKPWERRAWSVRKRRSARKGSRHLV